MEKAYDLNDLEEKLKAAEIPIAKGAGKAAIDCVFAWASESASMSESKVDDVMASLLPSLKSWIEAKLAEL